MPSIEELLNEAESHMAAQPVNDVLEIDPETREISIPDSEIILGVETDQKAERKYFHCPKIVGNNIDLSALELYVVFQNASNKEEGKDRYHVTDVKTTSDGYITFSWELSAKVTAYKGDVQFVVCAIKTDSSGVKQNVWNTTIAIGKCLIGLSSDMSESEEQSASDLYTQLISELNSTASAKLAEVTTQIQTVGNNQVSNVNNAGATQVNNVQNKGTEVLASIPDTYTELDASVKVLNEQIRGKAPVITESTTIQSGSPTTVTGSAEMQLQGLRLYGKSKQVVTTGKNLSSIKSCKLSANMASSDIVPWTKKDRIYFSCDTENVDGSKIYVICRYYNESKIRVGANGTIVLADGTRKEISFRGVGASSNGGNVDLTTIEYVNIEIGLSSASTAASSIDNIMVCDEENQTYEPYTGGKPSPSPEYPQEIVSVGEKGSIGVEINGKNLFGGKAFADKIVEIGGTLDEANKTVAIFASKIDGKVVYNFPNAQRKQYTIIVRGHNEGGSLDAVNLTVIYDDNTSSVLSTFNNGLKILHTRVDKTATSLKGAWNTGMSVFNYDLFGIFEGVLTEDDFEPYVQSASTISTPNGLPGIPVRSDTTGITYTDSDGQAWIADEIDFLRGKYVQRVWKGVFDGSSDEAWSYSIRSQRANIILNNGNLGTYDKRGIASMCSNLLWNRNVYSDSNRENGYLINNDTFFVRVAESLALNTEPDFRTWLASNPITLQYVLATPIETDLSEAQIQAYKSLTTFKPTSIISNDANAQMNVEYACDTKTWVTNKINTLIKEATTS